MNDQTTLPHDRIRELTIECFATENLELRARVADLESDARWLTDLLKAALQALHDALRRERNLDATNRRLMGLPDKYDESDNVDDRERRAA